MDNTACEIFFIDSDSKTIEAAKVEPMSIVAIRGDRSKIERSELNLLGMMFLRDLEEEAPSEEVAEYLNKLRTRSFESHIGWLMGQGYTYTPVADATIAEVEPMPPELIEWVESQQATN